jgi:uncharacterized delta-60 repeat protein
MPFNATPPSTAFTPSQIQKAYGFSNIKLGNIGGDGTGQTIAIVDAYDDPNIQSDLNTFDTQFGLPSATVTRVNQTGGTSYPPTDFSGNWETEESLDVEWAHAIAPGAQLLLVEANTNANDDLMTAVLYAAKHASVVSMSWGGPEYADQLGLTNDGRFNVPGVTFVASSGDTGAPASWPATSPNVLAVGGTSLILDANNNWSSESAWTGSGGGPSAREAQPSYQSGVVTQTTMRGSPDVAYDADPNTGFAVYDSFPVNFGNTVQNWTQIGGTSAGAPQWAALIAIANQGRVLSGQPVLDSTGPQKLLTAVYATANRPDFRDITTGASTGSPSYSAAPGYDLATGIGSPRADLVVASLVSEFEQNTAGQIDSTFGSAGKATVDFGGNDTVGGMAIQRDGRYIVAGSTSASGGNAVLTRFNPDGTLDTTFGTLGKVILNVPSLASAFNAVAVQSDGKIIAVGNVAVPNTTQNSFLIARFLRNGTLDTSFGSGGEVTVNFEPSFAEAAESVVIQPDGKIIAAGYANTGGSSNGLDDFALVRLNTNGSLDDGTANDSTPSDHFGTAGKVTTNIGATDIARAIALQLNGRIVIGGQTGPLLTAADFALARYNSDGSLDTTFGSGGIVMTNAGGLDAAQALVIQPDQRIVAAGHATVGGNAAFGLARFNADGSLDSNFGASGTHVDVVATDTSGLRALAIQTNGKLVAAGAASIGPGGKNFEVVRYTPDGVLDAAFGVNGVAVTDFSGGDDIPASVGINATGGIVVAGSITNASAGIDFGVAQYAGDAITPLLYSSWTPIGPAPLLNGSPDGGPVSGRITGIAADPHDPNTFYIAAAGGGIWKTTDGGSHWLPLTDHLSDSSGKPIPLAMGSVAVDPLNAQVIYAGTGEANNSIDSFYGRGILKSTDGGATWTLNDGPGGVFERTAIAKIVVDPLNDNVVFAVVDDFAENGVTGAAGIWKSTDAGATWANTTSGITATREYSDLVIDPTNDSNVYMAIGTYFGGTENGVYKSTSGGADGTWTRLTNVPNGATDTQVGRITMALSSDAQNLYVSIALAVTQFSSSSPLYKMLKITGGGTTVTDQTGNTPNYMGGSGFGQGWYDTTLAVSPTNNQVVFAGGSGNGGSPDFIESTDGGQSWTDLTNNNRIGPHTDDHAIGFNANGLLLDGNDGGIFALTNPNPTGPAWADLNGNLSTIQFTGIALDPTNPTIAYGGSQDNGTEKYTGGLAWNEIDGGDGGFVRVDPTNPNTVYHAFTGGDIERSDDGGQTWTDISSGIADPFFANFYAPYVLDPSNSSTVVFGTDVVNRSTDRGAHWSSISQNFDTSSIQAVAIAPTDSNTIYASTDDGGLFATTNGGATNWVSLSPPSAGPFTDLKVDPSDSQSLYAVVGDFTGSSAGHVLHYFHGAWTDMSGNIPDVPVQSMAIVTAFGATQFVVGTNVGVYVSSDQGATWAPYMTGLPNAEVVSLEYNSNLNILAAGTHGRGMWEIKGSGTNIKMLSSTTSGTTLTLQYQITGIASSAFGIGLFEAPTNQFQSQNATFVGAIQVTAAADLSVGIHTKVYTIGSGAGQVPLPGAGSSDPGNGNYLVAVANYQDTVYEYDDDAFHHDDTTVTTGVYHTTGGVVEVDAGDAAATISMAGGVVQVVLNGATSNFTPADVTRVIIRTHSGNDSITIGASIPVPVVIYSGTGNDALTIGATNLSFSGGSGTDTATITDATGTDTVSLSPGSATVTGNGHTITLTNTANITFNGNVSDTVDLYDSAGTDTFTASPGSAHMVGAGYNNVVTGIKNVTGHSAAGGSDSATLSDTAGTNTLTVTVASATFSGTTFKEQALGFASVTANAAVGTTDTANLFDSSGSNNFTASPVSATFMGTGLSETANGFSKVIATAASGTTDSATLSDFSGSNTFSSAPGLSTFFGTGFYNQVKGFASVTANAASGTTDTAYLYDASGSNAFTASPTGASFTGNGLLETANHFAKVYGFAATGTTDSATLSDVSGSNTFSAAPGLATFSGTGFFERAYSFASVLGIAANGTHDSVTLTDASGSNAFSVSPTTASFTGNGLLETAKGFSTVTATAASGTSDSATLSDGSGTNTFNATRTAASFSGTGFTYTANGFASVTANAATSADTANLRDASGTNTFTASPTSATFTGTGLSETAKGFGHVYGFAASGTHDSAILSDASGTNSFSATPSLSTFSGVGFYDQAQGFASVTANAAAGTSDTANLFDVSGSNTFTASPSSATFTGTGLSETANGFSKVVATGASGTHDSATLSDVSGSNTLSSAPGLSTFFGSGFYNQVKGFTSVTANAASNNSDTAYLYDASGSNTFTASPTSASFTGTGLSETTHGFAKVYAFAATGTSDSATLSDSSGSNTFTAAPGLATFTGNGFFDRAYGFVSVKAVAATGTSDSAILSDVSGSNTFSSAPGVSTFFGTGFFNQPKGFASVTANAASGTTDTAYLYDASGSNAFTASPTSASFTGTGLLETATHFAKVYGFAATGTTDSATLSDASGSNTFSAAPGLATFSGTGFFERAYSFASVTGLAANGTHDSATLADASGSNSFVVSPTSAKFTGNGLSETAKGFSTVTATAAGGTSDTATLSDGAGTNTFNATPTAASFSGTGFTYTANGFASVTANAATSADTANLRDASGTNTFTASPTSATFTGTGLSETANHFAKVFGYAATGTHDSATLSDTSGSNTFTATPTFATFSGIGFSNRANGFASVTAIAAGGTTDTANLSDTSGSNTFIATQTSGAFAGNGWSNTASSFSKVIATAASGTTDSATLSDTSGSNVFSSSPSVSTFFGTGFYNQVKAFASVTANAASGTSDTAYLYDASGSNTFTASQTSASFTGAGLSETANSFSKVYAFAATGTSDSAVLSDTSGTNTFSASPTLSYFTGSGFNNRANGFASVAATAGSGTNDTATLTDASGSNTFTSSPTSASFTGTGLSESANGFAHVTATAANGTTDTANFSDSVTSPGAFTGRPTTSSMVGSGYSNTAVRFVTVTATAVNKSDVADLYDDALGALYSGSGSNGSLTGATGTNYSLSVAQFGTVNIHGATGASNKYHVDAIDYLLNRIGSWTQV